MLGGSSSETLVLPPQDYLNKYAHFGWAYEGGRGTLTQLQPRQHHPTHVHALPRSGHADDTFGLRSLLRKFPAILETTVEVRVDGKNLELPTRTHSQWHTYLVPDRLFCA